LYCAQGIWVFSGRPCTAHKLTVKFGSAALSLVRVLFPSVASHHSGPWIVYRTNKTQFWGEMFHSSVKFRHVMSLRQSKKSWSDTFLYIVFFFKIYFFFRTGVSVIASTLWSFSVFHRKRFLSGSSWFHSKNVGVFLQQPIVFHIKYSSMRLFKLLLCFAGSVACSLRIPVRRELPATGISFTRRPEKYHSVSSPPSSSE